MRALVTGAAGFIGSHLSERLLAEGWKVCGVDTFTDYYDPGLKRANVAQIQSADFHLVEDDLNEMDLGSLLAGVDVVFHLAGQPGVRASWGESFSAYLDQNVRASQRLLEACRGAGTGRVVYASSSSIYGDAERFPTTEDDMPAPISPYGVTKLAAEHLCRLYARGYDVPTVSLRYFTIYGPRQRPDMAFNRFIAAAIADDPVVVYGDGLQVRDFTYVDDVVAATFAAAGAGQVGGVYNIAGGTQTTIREVLDTIGELTGKSIRIDHRDAVPGDARRTGADTTAARHDLGYTPAVGLREGLARQVEHAKDSAR